MYRINFTNSGAPSRSFCISCFSCEPPPRVRCASACTRLILLGRCEPRDYCTLFFTYSSRPLENRVYIITVYSPVELLTFSSRHSYPPLFVRFLVLVKDIPQKQQRDDTTHAACDHYFIEALYKRLLLHMRRSVQMFCNYDIFLISFS